MKEPKFKKGEWCFCEFELQQVMETQDGRIVEVSDAFATLSSYDLTSKCFPLDLEIKRISDSVEHWNKRFHALNVGGLNHPDLHRKLIEIWVEMCENKDDQDALSEGFERLSAFGKDVVGYVENAKSTITIEGVQLFRQ